MPKYTSEQRIKVFWNRVDKSGGDDACWKWTAGKTEKGYGRTRWNGRNERVHRVAYSLTYGEIPDGLCVCHTCDNRACCNPTHLWLGTHQENMRDMKLKGRAIAPKGENQHNCKLTDVQVAEIRAKYFRGDISKAALGRQYGVSHMHIRRIVKYETRL